jgi:PIN domain nuclease of toxin-antitoxin system
MRVLLDTHTFLWWVADDPILSDTARSVIANERYECFVSVASCWEMAIKTSIGKLRLSKPVERFVPEEMANNDFQLLPIEFKHVAKVEILPFHHRDPFDRLLASQALTEKMSFISADAVFSDYGIKRIW